MKTREVHLVARPTGWPEPGDFAIVERELPAPADGEALVRNVLMSVDPYMRGRMNDAPSYAAPYRLREVMHGAALGEVVESRSPELAVGDTVVHNLGWREHALGPAQAFQPVRPPEGVPASAYLSALGGTGFTAYVGLLEVAAMKPGDVVFVSAAAGAVGSMAGQIARLRGASRVIGSAGSDRKVAYLTGRLGFDAAFDYKAGPVRDQLAAAAPDGIDVYFDNVGGDHLEAAIGAMRDFGRIAVCGMISGYNATGPRPGPRNMELVLTRRLTMRGFIIVDHAQRRPEFLREASGWVQRGEITFEETYFEGLDNAVAAFLAMLHGANTGKMLVRL
jgi:NADPH-dependent curcumin reductase CurA